MPFNSFDKAPSPAEKGPDTDSELDSALRDLIKKVSAEQGTSIEDTQVGALSNLMIKHSIDQDVPLTLDEVSTPEFRERIVNGIKARNTVPETKTNYAVAQNGVVLGEVSSKADIQRMAEENRSLQEDAPDA